MRKILKSVTLNPEMAAFIQRIEYELSGYQAILTSILRDDEFKYNKETYEKFNQEYQEKYKEFRLATNHIEDLYALDLKDVYNLLIRIHYTSCNVDFYIEEGNDRCAVCK